MPKRMDKDTFSTFLVMVFLLIALYLLIKQVRIDIEYKMDLQEEVR